jgi:hypothetical protein
VLVERSVESESNRNGGWDAERAVNRRRCELYRIFRGERAVEAPVTNEYRRVVDDDAGGGGGGGGRHHSSCTRRKDRSTCTTEAVEDGVMLRQRYRRATTVAVFAANARSLA